MKQQAISLLIVLSLFLICSIGLAKRSAPEPVAPVVHQGVEYVAIQWGKSKGYDQNGGIVEAIDTKTGKKLWHVVVYKIDYNESLEGDVQDVFITKMSVKNGTLKVENERNETYFVDLDSHNVSPTPSNETKDAKPVEPDSTAKTNIPKPKTENSGCGINPYQIKSTSLERMFFLLFQ